MLRLVLLPLLLLLSLSLQAQPAVQAWPAPDGTPFEASCTTHGPDRICRHPDEGGPGALFTAERNGQAVGRWAATGGTPFGFRVFEADLDDDGALEHIVANHDAVSNGLGVSYWTLFLLDDGRGTPALSIPVEEFGPEGGSFAEDEGLVLWATEWLHGPDPSGRRGPGLYFVGRPFRLAGGRLAPAADLPIRARRLLDSFARERSTGTPVQWLTDRRAETRASDPYLLSDATTEVAGVIVSVAPTEAEFGATNWVLHLQPAEGPTVVYTYAFGYGPDLARPFTYLGDAATGRLYPPGYLVSEPAQWLMGRRVRAMDYGTDDDPHTVLWLD